MDVVPGRPFGRELVLFVMYLAAFGIGAFQVLHPTQLIEAQGWLVLVWALMILAGGALGVIAVTGRWWIPELVAQPLIGFPFLAWGQAAATASSAPSRWAFVSLCVFVICGCVHRAADIWWLAQQQPGSRP